MQEHNGFLPTREYWSEYEEEEVGWEIQQNNSFNSTSTMTKQVELLINKQNTETNG